MTTQGLGKARIDGVQVADITIQVDPSISSAMLAAKYAMLSIETGDRFGSGNKNVGWSDRTKEALIALLESLEKDICADLFEDGSTSSGVVQTEDTPIDDTPGF